MQALDSEWLVANGEMARRIRAHNWDTTPLGPIERWPLSLRTALNTVLDHPLPMILAWGPELITFYNDPYRPLLGDKPEALGRALLEVWSGARDRIAPQVARALAGQPSRFEDAPLTILQGDRPEEAFLDYWFSPVRDETGAVAGILNTAIETTGRKRRESDQTFLIEITKDMSECSSEIDLLRTVGPKLSAHMGLTCFHYVEIDEERGVVTIRYFWHALDVPPLAGNYPIEGFITPEELSAMRAGTILAVNDVETDLNEDDPRTAAIKLGAAAQKIAAFIAVPFCEGGKWKSYFAVADSKPRQWTDLEVTLAREIIKPPLAVHRAPARVGVPAL